MSRTRCPKGRIQPWSQEGGGHRIVPVFVNICLVVDGCSLWVKIHGNPGTELRSLPLLHQGLTSACGASIFGLLFVITREKDWSKIGRQEDHRRKKMRGWRNLRFGDKSGDPKERCALKPSEIEKSLDLMPTCGTTDQIWTVALDSQHPPRAPCLFKKWRPPDKLYRGWDVHLNPCQPVEACHKKTKIEATQAV